MDKDTIARCQFHIILARCIFMMAACITRCRDLSSANVPTLLMSMTVLATHVCQMEKKKEQKIWLPQPREPYREWIRRESRSNGRWKTRDYRISPPLFSSLRNNSMLLFPTGWEKTLRELCPLASSIIRRRNKHIGRENRNKKYFSKIRHFLLFPIIFLLECKKIVGTIENKKKKKNLLRTIGFLSGSSEVIKFSCASPLGSSRTMYKGRCCDTRHFSIQVGRIAHALHALRERRGPSVRLL